MTEFVYEVPTDHPAFSGHFPDRPILPGVVLLGLAIRTLGEVTGRPLSPCEVAQAKFLKPVGPGTRLRIRHARQSDTTWRFDILDDDDAVASGILKVSR